MTKKSATDDSLVISYLGLRKAVGVIGLALPFALALGKILFDGGGLQSSMSGYYHTNMRNLFVGSLCAIAVFLMSYWGYDRKDNIAAKIASVFAIGVAFFPTYPEVGATAEDALAAKIHFISAAGFFLTLAFFSLFLFRRTDPKKPPTSQKRKRNVVYMVCGLIMLISIVLIGILAMLPWDAPIKRFKPVFWLESLAVVAFGVSWLTKGEAILED